VFGWLKNNVCNNYKAFFNLILVLEVALDSIGNCLVDDFSIKEDARKMDHQICYSSVFEELVAPFSRSEFSP